jgi:hypothetical protein
LSVHASPKAASDASQTPISKITFISGWQTELIRPKNKILFRAFFIAKRNTLKKRQTGKLTPLTEK